MKGARSVGSDFSSSSWCSLNSGGRTTWTLWIVWKRPKADGLTLRCCDCTEITPITSDDLESSSKVIRAFSTRLPLLSPKAGECFEGSACDVRASQGNLHRKSQRTQVVRETPSLEMWRISLLEYSCWNEWVYECGCALRKIQYSSVAGITTFISGQNQGVWYSSAVSSTAYYLVWLFL